MSHQATIWIRKKHKSDDKAAAKADDINSVLPDEVLEEILVKLSVTSIARVGTVCNKWKEIAQSTTFIDRFLGSPSRKSWFWMLTFGSPHEHVYDPAIRKWRRLVNVAPLLPQGIFTFSPLASASGLICAIPDDQSRKVYVYNPITNLCRTLVDRPTTWTPALSMSVDRNTRSYIVAVIRSYNHRGVCKLAIDVYSSDKLSWETSKEVIVQRPVRSRSCVICDGILYSVLQGSFWDNSPTLWTYDLASPPSDPSSLEDNLIQFPCHLKLNKVMNIKEKLVIAAEIETGIIIWHLKDKELIEVAMAPYECCKRLGMFQGRAIHLMFQSGGFDEIIYIWNCVKHNILMFDMVSGQWRWTRRRPLSDKRFFEGICFEPRFDIVP